MLPPSPLVECHLWSYPGSLLACTRILTGSLAVVHARSYGIPQETIWWFLPAPSA